MISPPKNSVLLVEDNLDLAWALGRYLTRKGFQVATCANGAEAIALLRERSFTAMVTDILMAEVNGLALVEWVRRNKPRMRVIVMTAFGSPAVRELVMRSGAEQYLEKPVDPDILYRLLIARKSTDSFLGVLDGVDLFDYMQLILMSNRRLILEVMSAEGLPGRLYLDGGNVVHAECGDLEGEGAFFQMLSFEGGSFTSQPWAEPSSRSIERAGSHLLMDAAVIKDEARRDGGAPLAEPDILGLEDWEDLGE